MTTTRRRGSRGFTLIELMISVSIIGLLATMALPTFQRMTLRARVSERATLMEAIARGVIDMVSTLQSLPDPANQITWTGIQNPPGLPGTDRRDFSYAVAGWSFLPMIIEGATFYSYSFVATNPKNGAATLTVLAVGDLDGDRVFATKQVNYLSAGWTFYRDLGPGGEVPAPGLEDEATFGSY
jgi:prepilin-type N-terminal cleavage/methylation domain-containing protein